MDGTEPRDGMDPSRLTLRFLVAPEDAPDGRVEAGKVLEWVDYAGYACAVAWSGRYSVTAYVGNGRPAHPISSGRLVEVAARLVHTGRTSMHILVTVSSADPAEQVFAEALECLTVFVAIDEQRRAIEVAPWVPRNAEDVALQEAVRERIGRRRFIEAAMADQVYSDGGTAPETVLRFPARPSDVNWGGKVHGGAVMRWIDEGARICASGWSGRRTTCAYAGGIRFYRPLQIGDLVEVRARLLHTGRSSMHVSIHVRSAPITGGELSLTTHCMMVLVALDDDGRPAEVPAWHPVSEEDRTLDRHARYLMGIRGEYGQPVR